MIYSSHYAMRILSYLQSGQTALMKASSGGHVECVTVLLDRGTLADRSDEVSVVSYQVLSA